MNIYKKLLVIQKELKGLAKDKQGNNYSYVTGNKLLDFLKPIMNEQGLILKQEVTKVETERNDYTTAKGSNKSEILYKVWQKFTWIDTETGDKDENEFFSAGQNDWEKGLGSALTYAERYFLLKYFHIATDEDDIDNSERKAKEEEKIKADEIDLKGKLEKELLDFIDNDIDKFNAILSSLNKGYRTENTGFNQFTSTQLETYLNKKVRGVNK